MYVFVWNNEIWPAFPPFDTPQPGGTRQRTFDLPPGWDTQVDPL